MNAGGARSALLTFHAKLSTSHINPRDTTLLSHKKTELLTTVPLPPSLYSLSQNAVCAAERGYQPSSLSFSSFPPTVSALSTDVAIIASSSTPSVDAPPNATYTRTSSSVHPAPAYPK